MDYTTNGIDKEVFHHRDTLSMSPVGLVKVEFPQKYLHRGDRRNLPYNHAERRQRCGDIVSLLSAIAPRNESVRPQGTDSPE